MTPSSCAPGCRRVPCGRSGQCLMCAWLIRWSNDAGAFYMPELPQIYNIQQAGAENTYGAGKHARVAGHVSGKDSLREVRLVVVVALWAGLVLWFCAVSIFDVLTNSLYM